MQSELMLRRSWAENPAYFDMIRREWRRRMMRLTVKRDSKGRFASE